MLSELTVVTLNTWKCDGRYRDRLTWMADGLANLSPHFVFVQEAFVCDEPAADTAMHLGQALGMELHRLKGREKLREFEGDRRLSSSDLAILARTKPLHREACTLAEHSLDRDRKALVLHFDWRGIPLALANTHLTHVQDEEGREVRRRQVRQLLDLAPPPPGGICILGGDLNAAMPAAELEPLHRCDDREQLSPAKDDSRGTMQGGVHRPNSRPPRIDHLFVYKSKDCNAPVTYSESGVHLNVPVGPHGEFPSDHAAVSAKLSVDTD